MTPRTRKRVLALSYVPVMTLVIGGCSVDPQSATEHDDATEVESATRTLAPACGNGIVDAGEQCDDDNAASHDGCSATCTIELVAQFSFTGAAGNEAAGGTWRIDNVTLIGGLAPIVAPLYVKAFNTDAQDQFGFSVALSADGSTMAVGAVGESSGTGDPADNSVAVAGAVFVFERAGDSWIQQAYLKAPSTDEFDGFGYSVALSADGSTLVVGAPFEDSAATGIDGDPIDNSAQNAGAVYVFARSGATWSQQAYIKASNTGVNDRFGVSVALSHDATIMALGAQGEASAATGIGGDQTDDSRFAAWAVYVYRPITARARQGGASPAVTDDSGSGDKRPDTPTPAR